MTNALSPQELKAEALRLFEKGDHGDALGVFKQASLAFAKQGDLGSQAEMLNNMGVIQRVQGKAEAAVSSLTQAADLFAQIGDLNRQAQSQANLGDLYATRKKYTEAARCYSDAAAQFAQIAEKEKQAQVLRALSLMELRRGQWLSAVMRMEESLQVRPRLSIPQHLFKWLLRFATKLLRGE